MASAAVSNEQVFKEKHINSSYSQTSPAEIPVSAAMAPSANQLLPVNCNANTAEPAHALSPSPGVILGSTPLSQIGAHSVSASSEANTLHGMWNSRYKFRSIDTGGISCESCLLDEITLIE